MGRAGITYLAYSLPERKLTDAELSDRFGSEYMKRILPATGILERRVASEGECASDFAAAAAERIFSAGVNPESVDIAIMATQTPDYMVPTTACMLQTRLRIPTDAAAFDISLGCSQFVYALGTANAWIGASMARRVLAMSGDTPTRMVNPMDKSAVPIFGDGGAACVVEEVSDGGFLGFDFGSDGRGWKDLIKFAGGMRLPSSSETAVPKCDESGSVRSLDNLFMDGGKILLFAIRNVPASVGRALRSAGLSERDADLYIFHQASEMVVRSVARKMDLPPEKVYYKLHDTGNIGGSSVAVALADAFLSGRLKRGDTVVLSAFGAGLSWGSCVLRLGDDFKGAFALADFSDSPPKPQSQRAADVFCSGRNC